SKGSRAIDNIERVENMQISGGLTITRSSASAFSVYTNIDASECINASIVCCHFGGGGVTRAANQGYGYPTSPPHNISCALGKGGVAISCRVQLNGHVGYAISGEGAAVIGCSAENQDVGVRIGWGMRRVTGTSNNGSGNIRLAL